MWKIFGGAIILPTLNLRYSLGPDQKGWTSSLDEHILNLSPQDLHRGRPSIEPTISDQQIREETSHHEWETAETTNRRLNPQGISIKRLSGIIINSKKTQRKEKTIVEMKHPAHPPHTHTYIKLEDRVEDITQDAAQRGKDMGNIFLIEDT